MIFSSTDDNIPIIVFIDEVHERSIYMDLILSYIVRHHLELTIDQSKRIIKFVLLSATIDVMFYKNFFNQCDINVDAITISGKRKFKISHRYLEIDGLIKNKINNVIDHIIEEYISSKSDILIFLPTKSLCNYGVQHIVKKMGEDCDNILIKTLYGTTPQNIKDLLTGVENYMNHGYTQRIIFSTPISETGITFKTIGERNIDIVIDFGYKNIVIFDPKTGFFNQMIKETSQSSVVQRCGRVGRVADGTCYHIYPHNKYMKFNKYISPQINTTNYYNLIINFLKLRKNIYDVMIDIKFLPTPIDKNHLNFALLKLYTMGILYNGKFSLRGTIASDLGISERLGILIMNSFKYHDVVRYIIPIAIFININSNILDWIPISNITNFKNKYGSPISFLKLWLEFKKSNVYQSPRSSMIYIKRLRDWCNKNDYNYELFFKMVTSLKKTDERLQKYSKQLSTYFISEIATIPKPENDDNNIPVSVINKIMMIFSTTFSDIRLKLNTSRKRFNLYGHDGSNTKISIRNYFTPMIDFATSSLIGCTDVIITERGFPIIVCPFVIK